MIRNFMVELYATNLKQGECSNVPSGVEFHNDNDQAGCLLLLNAFGLTVKPAKASLTEPMEVVSLKLE